jgi:beta-glucosidase
MDLEMPNNKYFNKDAIQPLLDSGQVTWATIDDKCRRILRVAMEMGAFDRPQKDESIPLDNPASNETALQIAREGIVLLKNDNHALPLDRTKIKTIAVVGPNCDVAAAGGGSSYTTPTHPVSVLEGLKAKAGDGVNVIRVPSGFERLFDDFVQNSSYVQPLSATFYNDRNLKGDPTSTQTVEHVDFNWTDTPPPNTPKENFSARFTGQIEVKEAGKYLFVMESDDGSRAFVDDKRIMNMWRNHGKEKRMATLDLEPGKHDVKVEYYNDAKDASLRFGWGKTAGVLDDSAKQQLASADAVICCVGFNRDTESEGSDRTFELPYPQDELIKLVSAANPHTIVVLNSGGNVDMNAWIDGVPSLLHAWYPGQAGGTAIAEILLGDTNPSGKLPQSWEKRFEDNAAFGQVSYPGEAGQVNYHEGIFVGYRHLDRNNIEPRFCFGHGLSYTTFKYSNLKVEPVTGTDGSYQATVDITNTGDRAGSEAVQLYVRQVKCTVERPVRELKGFARVDLKPGDTKQAKILLNRDAFAYYSMSANGWVVDPGEFELQVGPSSRELPLKQTIQVK